MISFYLGPSGSDAKAALFLDMERTAQTRPVFFLVPEQISLQTEREIQHRFSAAISRNIMVLSFTRLADYIFKQCGGIAGQYANPISKRIFMELSLEMMRDRMELYRDSLDRPGFGTLLLRTAEEVKSAGYTPSDFAESIAKIPEGELRRKAGEFSEIFSVYNSQLMAIYRDPSDNLHRAACWLEEKPLFQGAAFFFDSFSVFHGAQIQMLSKLFAQCECTFSLCCEPGDPLFATTQRTMRTLTFLATRQGVKVKKPHTFPAKEDKPLPLQHLERTVLRVTEGESSSPGEHISVLLATNEYSEMDEIFSQVWRLVKEGYRFSDIVLLTRDLEGYRSALEGALKRYRIPYFMDEKKPVASFPLFRVVEHLLKALLRPTPEALLGILKSGCTGFSIDEISCFENYLYTWQIKARDIRQPFVQPYKGFLFQEGESLRDQQHREMAEHLRQQLIAAIDSFSALDGTARSYSEALLNVLEELGVRAVLQQQISECLEKERLAEGQELTRSWELFCEILKQLVTALEEMPISLQQFQRFYLAAVSACEMGELPQTLDAVTIGTVDRTLPGAPKIVFVFGANDGVFPFVPNSVGLFRQTDEIELKKYGISLATPIEEAVDEERLLAYQAVTAATERVYLSARLSDISGGLMQPSEVITGVLKLFGDAVEQKPALQEQFLSLCQTEESARLQLAFHYRENTSQAATLREYFKKDREFMEQLERTVNLEKQPFALKDSILRERLYGKKMRLSPSQLDTFYRCPFAYFCRYGLSVKKREKAELSALSIGTIVHTVLETLLQNPDFMKLSVAQLKERISTCLNELLQKQLGGNLQKNARFYRQYRRVGEQMVVLCQNIQREFAVTEFQPAAFELYLGEDTQMTSAEIPFGEGGVATVVGKVDRVDTFCTENRVYLRVVDYKSGEGKQFSLSELYQGLNLQMLLYLFSLCSYPQNEKELIPSGVLYLPATGTLRNFCFDRPTSAEERDEKISAGFCRNGLLLEDPVSLSAMEFIEPGTHGKYLPIRLKKDGSPYRDSNEFLVNREQFDLIFRFVRQQVSQMCEQLLDGQIGAVPLSGMGGGKEKACKYCDYHSVCGYSAGETRELTKMNKDEFFERIGGESEC